MADSRFIPRADFSQIKIGICPACNQPNFALGPRGGLARNILCVHCFREYKRQHLRRRADLASAAPIPDSKRFTIIVRNPIAGHPQA